MRSRTPSRITGSKAPARKAAVAARRGGDHASQQLFSAAASGTPRFEHLETRSMMSVSPAAIIHDFSGSVKVTTPGHKAVAEALTINVTSETVNGKVDGTIVSPVYGGTANFTGIVIGKTFTLTLIDGKAGILMGKVGANGKVLKGTLANRATSSTGKFKIGAGKVVSAASFVSKASAVRALAVKPAAIVRTPGNLGGEVNLTGAYTGTFSGTVSDESSGSKVGGINGVVYGTNDRSVVLTITDQTYDGALSGTMTVGGVGNFAVNGYFEGAQAFLIVSQSSPNPTNPTGAGLFSASAYDHNRCDGHNPRLRRILLRRRQRRQGERQPDRDADRNHARRRWRRHRRDRRRRPGQQRPGLRNPDRARRHHHAQPARRAVDVRRPLRHRQYPRYGERPRPR